MILFDKDYVKGNFDTGYLDRKMPELLELYEKSSEECGRDNEECDRDNEECSRDNEECSRDNEE